MNVSVEKLQTLLSRVQENRNLPRTTLGTTPEPVASNSQALLESGFGAVATPHKARQAITKPDLPSHTRPGSTPPRKERTSATPLELAVHVESNKAPSMPPPEVAPATIAAQPSPRLGQPVAPEPYMPNFGPIVRTTEAFDAESAQVTFGALVERSLALRLR